MGFGDVHAYETNIGEQEQAMFSAHDNYKCAHQSLNLASDKSLTFSEEEFFRYHPLLPVLFLSSLIF